MGPLLNAVMELVVLLSPARIEAIASRIRGIVYSEWVVGDLYQIVGTPTARSALDSLMTAWKESAFSGDVVCGFLIGATHARLQSQRDSVELVWTGPTTPFVATRRTEQVLLDVIHRAKAELFIVSFVAYDVPSVVSAINAAVDRGVRTRILLEASSTHGGSLSVDPVATMGGCAPSALLYAWTDRPHPFTNGRVHAKVAVADSDL